ncbi:MAG: aldehyde dehydrogenase EutE, partial [Pirellula sp.]
MHINETLIRSVVEQVISQVRIQAGSQGTVSSNPGSSNPGSSNPGRGHSGLFDNVDDAVAAARSAFEQLQKRPIEDRKKIIDVIRRISISQCGELGTMEMEETKIGRLKHKIEKLKTLGEKTPGVEFLKTECYSGDR